MPFCGLFSSAVCKRKSDLCMRQLHIGTGSSDQMGRQLWLILGFEPDGLDLLEIDPRASVMLSSIEVNKRSHSVSSARVFTAEEPGSLALTSETHRL